MKSIILGVILMLSITSCSNSNRESHSDNIEIPTRDFDAIFKSKGIVLPTLGPPKANYVHTVRTGNLIFNAGKGPQDGDGNTIIGKLGKDMDTVQGYDAARWAGIQQIAALKLELGDLNKVKRIVKVLGMVNCTPDFKDQSKVINGYSDLMVEVFGEAGKHARSAVGMGSLPNGIAVEIEMIVEVY